MDNEDFLRRLSEVSEWHRPQVGQNGFPNFNKGRRPKNTPAPRQITEQELDAMTEEELEQYHNELMAWREAQPNDSIAPEIKAIKPQPTQCDDCGQMLDCQRRVEKKLHITGQRHWRVKCVNCQCYQHPGTGKFTVKYQQSHQFFCDYYRLKKGLYRSKYQPDVRPESKTQTDHTPQDPESEPVSYEKYIYYVLVSGCGDNVIKHRREILLPEIKKDK